MIADTTFVSHLYRQPLVSLDADFDRVPHLRRISY
jgi:hypothetical protein